MLVITEIKPDSPFLANGVSVGAVFLKIESMLLKTSNDIEIAKQAAFESGGPMSVTVFEQGDLRTFDLKQNLFGIIVTETSMGELSYTMNREHWATLKRSVDQMHSSEQIGIDSDAAQNIILTTTPEVPGKQIVEVVDVITAESVFGVNLFQDLFSGIRDIVGGRAQGQQSVLREARKVCLEELRVEAVSIGADAVVGIDLDYSEISGGKKSMLFLVASGTAVKLTERID